MNRNAGPAPPSAAAGGAGEPGFGRSNVLFRKMPVLALVCLACLASGCAKRVDATDLAGGGADVGVTVTLKSGESLRGRLMALDGEEMTVEASYVLGGDASVSGAGEARRVEIGGSAVPGRLVSVRTVDESRVATVERGIDIGSVARATFHRSAGDASLGPVLSLIVGPAVGALLALAI